MKTEDLGSMNEVEENRPIRVKQFPNFETEGEIYLRKSGICDAAETQTS